MFTICRVLFRAIHEGRWVKIEYRNQQNEQTVFWIGIKNLDPWNRTLDVEGFSHKQYSINRYKKIFIASIM